jgi:hypothetical protein
MRPKPILAAVGIVVAAVGARCGAASSSGGGDLAQVGGHLAAALVQTAAAKDTTPVLQQAPPPTPLPPTDRDSVDALLQALYEGVSHAADAQPDWARLQALFVTGAGLTPPTHGGEGNVRALSFDQFQEAVLQGIASRRQQGAPRGFFEREIGRETTSFGTLTQVTSAYEARFRAEDPAPFLRGVNFIQLVRSGNRWAVVSIAWDTEGPENPIPQSLLPSRPPVADPAPTPSR